jgi:hypothetical protein
MPCRDYEDDNRYENYDSEIRALKKQNDRLARIACNAMTALEEDGRADLLLLKDDEVRTWWKAHKIADAKAQADKIEKERLARVKQEALSKLSAEERKVLGIKS